MRLSLLIVPAKSRFAPSHSRHGWFFSSAAGADDANPRPAQSGRLSELPQNRGCAGGLVEDDPARHRFHARPAWRCRSHTTRSALASITRKRSRAFRASKSRRAKSRRLFVAQKALAQYRGTPFERPLRSAFRKIADSLKERVSFSWSDMEDAISFHSAGASVADLELFETVSQAVLRSVEVELEYRKLNSNGYEPRRVRPFHIACLENQWYLFAEDLERKQLRTFALPRMRKVQANEQTLPPAGGFLDRQGLEWQLRSFRRRQETSHPPEVRRLCRASGERTHWHESQRFRAAKDGSAILELELGGLEEIERWVLSWGSHVRVKDPLQLRERIRAEAEAVARIYQTSGNAAR